MKKRSREETPLIHVEDLENIRNRLNTLKEENSEITIDIYSQRPKIIVESGKALIKGVYRNFFTLEEYSIGVKREHSFQFQDVASGVIKIHEF